MADNEGFAGDPLVGGSFSQLLFAADDILGLETENCFNSASSKMLCFGGNYPNESDFGALTISDSSSASPIDNDNIDAFSKSKRKEIESGNKLVQSLDAGAGAPAKRQRNYKKNKSENSTVTGHAKGKKQNIGERIAALQQIVSPYGKSDTASVLHETMGYIKFLQEQVQVLSSPYMQPSSTAHMHGGENGEGEPIQELRSRGLCLVPVEQAAHLANDNGADFWAPALDKPPPKH